MMNEKILSKLTTVNVWVFDLDDTLYPRESGLWAQIDKRISAYVKKQLELDDDEEVKRFRQYFRKNYGGALRGLIEEYFVDVKDYLQDVHNIDYSPLKKDPQLAEDIKSLPGRKFIFTNGDRAHAGRVLAHRGLTGCFDGIYDVTFTDFLPKPYRQAYHRFLGHFSIDPEKTAMFEDNLANLSTCKELGMTTILVGHKEDKEIPAFVDIEAPELESFVHNLVGRLNGAG